jgi:hypothetical protein
VKGLIEMVPVFKELRGQVAVVGEKDEAGSGVFEIANRIDAFGKAAKKIAESFAALRIGERRDDLGWFVEEKIDVARSGLDESAGGFDFVGGRIGLGAEFSDDSAVDPDLAGENEFFGVTAGSDAGAGDNFLKAFEHGWLRIAEELPVASQ